VTATYCDSPDGYDDPRCTKTTVSAGKDWQAAESTTVGKKDLSQEKAFTATVKGDNTNGKIAGASKHQVAVLGGEG